MKTEERGDEAYHKYQIQWIADAKEQLARCEREEIDLEPEVGEEVIHNTQCSAPRWEEELKNLKAELILNN